mmetsp:Transcript_17062/g.51105  ORF Transcript_17062/g.51105 Transcript_17062/m.51105 type:complete len:229 (+) Transcript_17062:1025-1711(+)
MISRTSSHSAWAKSNSSAVGTWNSSGRSLLPHCRAFAPDHLCSASLMPPSPVRSPDHGVVSPMRMRRQSLAPVLRTPFRLSLIAARKRSTSACLLGGRLAPPKRAAPARMRRCHVASDSLSDDRLPDESGSFWRALSMMTPAAGWWARQKAPTPMQTALMALGTRVREVHSTSWLTMASATYASPCLAAMKSAVASMRGPARSSAAMASFFEGLGTFCTYSRKRSRSA